MPRLVTCYHKEKQTHSAADCNFKFAICTHVKLDISQKFVNHIRELMPKGAKGKVVQQLQKDDSNISVSTCTISPFKE